MSLRSTPAQNISGKIKVRTWIEIDAQALLHNYRVFRKALRKGVKLWSVVKSNAYGHGLLTVPHILAKTSIDGFCVDSITEAFRLRKEGIMQPILVLGYTLPGHYQEAARKNITITITTQESLEDLAKQKAKIPSFHIKIDTGLHRQGFYTSDLQRVIKTVRASKALSSHITGAYTHYAADKNANDQGYIEKQYAEFQKVKAIVREAGFEHLTFHAAASGATMLSKKYHEDAVRIGMALYGIVPSQELKTQRKTFNLKPVLSWRTIVTEIKPITKGARVGYDCTETIDHNGMIAVLPIGYWHSFPRSLSKIGEVLINGKRAKVMGRVSMDLVVVDITSIKQVKIGSVVTLIGNDGKDKITAEEFAEKADTSPYEALTRLNPLMERVRV